MCLCPTLETIHAKYVRNHHQDSNDDYVDVDDDNDDGGDGGNGDGNDNVKSVPRRKYHNQRVLFDNHYNDDDDDKSAVAICDSDHLCTAANQLISSSAL